MRPLIQYDLGEPPSGPSTPHPNSDAHYPPAKKRKRNHYNAQKSAAVPASKAPVQHWDDPRSTAVGVVYDEDTAAGSASVSYAEEQADEYGEEYEGVDEGVDAEQEEEEEGEESRPLTNEEIWDDSALIDAWNSAEAEYEAYHGTSKAWKTEPVKKSPLWYNKPWTAPPPKPSSKHTVSQSNDEEPDTAPIDFNTYVPTHDPSLGGASAAGTATTAPAAQSPFFVPPPSATMVSRDEAFQNALSAMYWSGYWTAVYHCQSQSQASGKSDSSPVEEVEDGMEADANENEEQADLVPAQR